MGGQTNRRTDEVIPIYPPPRPKLRLQGYNYFVQCNSMYMKENICPTCILLYFRWVGMGLGLRGREDVT